jgi:sporulation protein YlmC with PRC-barrel domain
LAAKLGREHPFRGHVPYFDTEERNSRRVKVRATTQENLMTLRHIAFGGAAAVALGAFAFSAQSATPARTTTTTTVRQGAPAAVTAPVTMPLDKVAAASLAKLRVVNPAGETVGTVVDVVTQADGKAIALTVDASAYLGAHRWVGINANRVALDRAHNVLIANMSKAEIRALPNLA